MALKGTLDDFSIIELLQFPYAGRKTGRLDITDRQGRTATVYYREGKLVHAASGVLEPIEAIVELVGWEHGDFVFHPDLKSERDTIDLDLHRLLMQALKIRDERNVASERRFQAMRRTPPASPPESPTERLPARLKELCGKSEAIRYIAVLTPDNRVVAESGAGDERQDYAPLRAALLNCLKLLKSGSPSRVLTDGASGAAVLMSLDSQRMLFVVGRPGEPLGAAAAATRKLAAGLLNK